MKKKISLFSLVMLTLSSLIGSGWLFGSWEAAKVAGPAAIFSWIIGAVVIGLIAFNYIELGAMFPERGGMSHYAQYTHGSLLGFIAAWANWISLVTIIPIEAVACVQYMSSWPWKWANWTHILMSGDQISNNGLFVVYIFIIIFTLLNYWSVKLLTRFTNFVSFFKLGIPILTIVMLVISGFHPQNFGSSIHEFMPYGTAAIFSATTVSGIIFSYDAFQTVINMGSEIQNPKKNIKRGVVLSLFIAFVIYVSLQITFIGVVKPSTIAQVGWHGLNFQSPFADLAIMLGMYWLSVLLYMEAFISPFGTGVSFVASGARTLAAFKENKHFPESVGKIHKKYGTPRVALVIDAFISIIMVTLFRNWGILASVISTATLIAFLTGPVSVVSLREMAPDFIRPVKLNHLNILAPISFVLASLAAYWAMWPTTIEVILIILIGLPIYFYYERRLGWPETKKHIKSSLWLLLFLGVLALLSYFGSTEFGGIGLIKYPFDFIILIIVSLIFYYYGIHSYITSEYFEQAKKSNQQVNLKDYDED